MNEEFNISGTWINRLTGDKIVVRNSIIDGDDMIIICADGRQLKMSEFQNYIQMSDKNSNDVDNTLSLGDIRGIEQERRVVVGADQYNVSSNNPHFYSDEQIENVIDRNVIKDKNESTSESEKLLSKLFEKIELDIDLKINLNCSNFPVKELNMLQMIYDVTAEDISNYITKNILDINVFKNAVTQYIDEQLTN